MRSKIITVQGKKHRVYLGKGCYFLTEEEAFHHRHGRYWRDALTEVVGAHNYRLSEAGAHKKLPLYSKELREFLEVPADPY